jgi:hypothetical protein
MKRAIIISTSIIFLIVVLLLATLTFMAGDIVAAYRPKLETKLSELLGATVKLQEMKLSLVPRPKLSVKSFAVLSANGDKGGVSVSELYADAAFWPLLAKRLEISQIVIDRPVVSLERLSLAEGFKIKGLDLSKAQASSANNKAVSAEVKGDSSPAAAAMAVSINRITINSGEIDLNDRVSNSNYKVKEIRLDSAVNLSGDLVRVPNLKLSMLAPGDQAVSLFARDASFKGGSGALGVPSATLKMAAGDVNISGSLNSDKSGSVAISSLGLKVDSLAQLAKGLMPGLNLSQLPKGASLDLNLSYNLASGVIDTTTLKLKAFAGELNSPTRISLRPIQRASSNLKVSALSIVELLGTFKPELASAIFGSLERFDFDLKDLVFSDPVRSAIGQGLFSLKDGGIRGLNIPAQLISSLEGQPFVAGSLRVRIPSELQALIATPDTIIRNLKGEIGLDGGVLKLTNFLLDSDLFSLRGPGEFNILSGELKLKSDLVFAPALSASIVARVRELSPLVDPTGHLVFPLVISGRMPKVIVAPDMAAILKVVSVANVDKVVAGVLKDKKIEKKLGKIFGF